MKRGEKKDKSGGDKNEWRKGNITLRLLGKKKEFSTDDEDTFKMCQRFRSNFKKETVCNFLSRENFTVATVKDLASAYKTTKNEHEENIANFKRTTRNYESTITGYKKDLARAMDIGAADTISVAASALKFEGLNIELKGKIALGGMSIPDPSITSKVIKAQAKSEALLAKLDALINAAAAKKQAIEAKEAALAAAAKAKVQADLALQASKVLI